MTKPKRPLRDRIRDLFLWAVLFSLFILLMFEVIYGKY